VIPVWHSLTDVCVQANAGSVFVVDVK